MLQDTANPFCLKPSTPSMALVLYVKPSHELSGCPAARLIESSRCILDNCISPSAVSLGPRKCHPGCATWVAACIAWVWPVTTASSALVPCCRPRGGASLLSVCAAASVLQHGMFKFPLEVSEEMRSRARSYLGDTATLRMTRRTLNLLSSTSCS